MSSKNILCGLVIAFLSLGSVAAFAQPSGRHDDRQDTKRDGRDAGPGAHGAKRGPQQSQRGRQDARQEHRYYNAREFRRGQRLPAEYRDRTYVVSNWRAHHLSAPPRGYHWVQVGPDYVLAAVATGLIANLILNQ